MRGAVIDLSVKKCLATHRKKAVSVFRLRSASSLRRRLGVSSLLAAVVFVPIAVGLTQGVASAAPTTPVAPFTECPAVGYNTSCSLLIDATGAGTSVLSDPNATTAADPTPGTYDGDDDTLIGVINNTSAPISSLPLSSTTEPIMAFDGDGICENPNDTSGLPGLPASDCANVNTVDTTGYGGPNSYFTGISLDYTSGVVNFIKPLAPGASTYFSLEEALSASQITVGGTDLAVSLDNFVTKLKAGRSMTYCATATNNGPLKATSVVVTLTLPAGLTVTNPEGGVVSGNTVTWTVPKLASGRHANFKAVVHDTATSGTVLTAVANVSGAQSDPNPANNMSSFVTTVI